MMKNAELLRFEIAEEYKKKYQLEENIKAKDVKKAEVIEHDQPIKQV